MCIEDFPSGDLNGTKQTCSCNDITSLKWVALERKAKIKYYRVCTVTCLFVFVYKLKGCQSSPRHPHSDSLPPITPAQYQTVIRVWSLALWLCSLTLLQPHFSCMCHFTWRQNNVSCRSTRKGGEKNIPTVTPLHTSICHSCRNAWHHSPGGCCFCQDLTDFSFKKSNACLG